MRTRLWRRVVVAPLFAVIVSGAVLGAPPASKAPAASPMAQYQRALRLGTEAYIYGYPLLDTDGCSGRAPASTLATGPAADR